MPTGCQGSCLASFESFYRPQASPTVPTENKQLRQIHTATFLSPSGESHRADLGTGGGDAFAYLVSIALRRVPPCRRCGSRLRQCLIHCFYRPQASPTVPTNGKGRVKQITVSFYRPQASPTVPTQSNALSVLRMHPRFYRPQASPTVPTYCAFGWTFLKRFVSIALRRVPPCRPEHTFVSRPRLVTFLSPSGESHRADKNEKCSVRQHKKCFYRPQASPTVPTGQGNCYV